jgi:hypothetical protein
MVGPVFGRQSRTPKERVDFSLAQLHHHTPQTVFPTLAMRAHPEGRRRKSRLFLHVRRHGGSLLFLNYPSRALSGTPC